MDHCNSSDLQWTSLRKNTDMIFMKYCADLCGKMFIHADLWRPESQLICGCRLLPDNCYGVFSSMAFLYPYPTVSQAFILWYPSPCWQARRNLLNSFPPVSLVVDHSIVNNVKFSPIPEIEARAAVTTFTVAILFFNTGTATSVHYLDPKSDDRSQRPPLERAPKFVEEFKPSVMEQ